jgi:hypothetical protein
VSTPELRIDNASTIKGLHTGAQLPVTWHIEIRNLWLIDKVKQGLILAHWISGDMNASDLGTKPLARTRLYLCWNEKNSV